MRRQAVAVILGTILLALAGGWMGIPASWGSGVWFTTPDLRVPAEDLVAFLSEKTGMKWAAALTAVDQKFEGGDWVLAGAVKNKNTQVESALSPADRAFLEGGGAESFVAANSGGVRYLVGGGLRGAAYASVRIQRSWLESAKHPLATEGENFHMAPAFKERVGGAGGPNPAEDYSQPKPADYDWETYARDLAHCGVNLTPGIIQGKTVPDEALRPWGIRKILAYSACPFSQADLRKWRQTNPNDVKPSENPRDPDSEATSWTPCPTTDFGRKVYREWLAKELADHKTAAKVVFHFSGWGAIPGEECSPGTKRWERVVTFLKEMDGIVKGISQDVGVMGSTRGLSTDEIRGVLKNLPNGVGLIFGEPSPTLLDPPEEGYDPSMATSQWNPTYATVIEEALAARPNDIIVTVAAGDTDSTVSPAVGMALPNTAHAKIQRLSQMKCANIALAMGGIHPWTYSPNVEVFKDMIWTPEVSAEDLITKIAHRDFGTAAEQVVGVWSLFDQAFAAYPLTCRGQRLEDFVRKSKDLVTKIPSPAQVRDNPWSRTVSQGVPYLLEGYPTVLRLWQEGVQRLQRTQDETEGASFQVAKNLRDGVFWASFYYQMLQSQYQVVRCLNVLKWVPEGASPTDLPWKQAFIPLYRDEQQNCERWQDLLFTAPEPQIRLENEAMNPTALARKLDQKRQALNTLIGD
jgi:hypothetical protein